MAKTNVPQPSDYKIDECIFEELICDVSPHLENQPKAWARTTASVRPGLELMVSGLNQSWHISPVARQQTLSIIKRLAKGKGSSTAGLPSYLHPLIHGFRHASRTITGSAAARLFARRMLEGLA